MLLPARFARLASVALIVVASAATTAGTSTTAASGTSAAATWSAGTTLGLGTGLVDIQRAPAEVLAIQSCDGFFGFRGVGHFYKRKPSGASGVTVGDQADLIDLTVGFKQGAQLGFRGAVREVANKKLLHGFPFSVSQRKTSGFVGGFGSVSRARMQRTRFKGKRVSSELN
jgi:hypothetical protein